MDATARLEIDRAAGQLLIRVADAIADDARRFVPVDTGRLREGIERGNVEGHGDHLSIKVYSRRPDPDPDREAVPVYVELGTRHMAAQPYMKPALFRTRVL